MKRLIRNPGCVRAPWLWAVAVGWIWSGGSFADPPAAPAVPAKAETVAGPSALRSELEAARARLLKLEESLAQASARRETAANDLVTVWKQLMASREELEQLRRQRDDNAQLASRTREVEMMLKTQGDELAAGRLRIETLRAEVDRLQAQNAEGERRLRENVSAAETAKQAQAETNRLAKALADALQQNAISERVKEQAFKTQVQLHQDLEASKRAAESLAKSQEQAQAQSVARIRELETILEAEKARAASLEQEKASQLKQVREQAEKQRQEAEALQNSLAEKEQALAKAEEHSRQLQENIAKLNAQA